MNTAQAEKHLKKILEKQPDTIISEQMSDRKTLKALRIISRQKKNDTVAELYNDMRLDKFLTLAHEYWNCQCETHYVRLREKNHRCPKCKYRPWYLVSPTREEAENNLN